MKATESAAVDMVEQSAVAVAALTGVKAQFVAAGWSEVKAEQLVIELFRWRPGAGADV